MIHRFAFSIAICSIAVCPIAICLLTAAAGSAAAPNIVWITVEDMSARLGCYGDTTVATPNIDRIAAEGTRFNHAYGVYGVCSPNRHCLILGMYPTSTGAMAMRTWQRTAALDMIKDPALLAIPTYEATPPPEARCFTEYLRAAGYYCSNNSKTDYQFRDPLTAWNESSAEAHWRNRPASDTPFFAVFNHQITHESRVFKQSSPAVTDPATVAVPPYYVDLPLVRRDLARHYDNIAAVDQQVGVLLQQLEDDELLDDTIVFFFSDHGDGLPRMKRWVYDSGIHVPLLVRFPRARGRATTNDQLISFVDFAPTVLNLAGLPLPAHMQGQPFLGANLPAPRKYIFAARDRMDPAPETIRAVRDKRFKYIRNYRPDLPYIGFVPYRDQSALMQEMLRLTGTGQLGPDQWQFSSIKKPLEELYDTQQDPHEIHNLASDPRHFVKLDELRSAHRQWTANTKDLGHISETELIKLLWPPAGIQPTTASPSFSCERLDKDQRRVTISCASSGASVAYRIDQGKGWELYVDPFVVPVGTKVVAIANRLGWKRSPTQAKTIQ